MHAQALTRMRGLLCLRAPQVQGGGLRDSFLVDGVAFKKTFSYAGFEMQPKSYADPKVLLLNIELELKSEKENAEVRLLGVFPPHVWFWLGVSFFAQAF
jgi:hypothetical protein